MRNVIFLFFLLINLTTINAQTITRSTLGCLGGTNFSIDGVSLKQTVGQPSNTQIFRSDGSVLSQGFQQNNVSSLFLSPLNEIEFLLSPNPASDRTVLTIKEYNDMYSLSIKNLQGNTVYIKSGLKQKEFEINTSNLPIGLYIVTVITEITSSSQKLIIQ